MGLPYQRRQRRQIGCFQLLLLLVGTIVLVIAWQQLGPDFFGTPKPTSNSPQMTPTMPERLTRRDVLPTPTPDQNAPMRAIVFPAAALQSRIINAVRTVDSWETRYLGDSVGHLEGTPWIDSRYGNIVLAGHVENETGKPGPFAYLFKVQKDDLIVLQDGPHSLYYRVTEIVEASPDEMRYVAQDGRPRLTLITCMDYDFKAQNYLKRLIVIAIPIPTGEPTPRGDVFAQQ